MSGLSIRWRMRLGIERRLQETGINVAGGVAAFAEIYGRILLSGIHGDDR